MDNPKPDREEQELNVEQELEKHVQYAKNTMKKDSKSKKWIMGGLIVVTSCFMILIYVAVLIMIVIILIMMFVPIPAYD